MDKLLKELCSIHSPSGEEFYMREFLINYFMSNMYKFQVKPKLIYGSGFQDCLIAVFGHPRVGAFAHMDTTGFAVRYQDQLIPIGSPEIKGDEKLTGMDHFGEIECAIDLDINNQLHYRFGRAIQSGTTLTFRKNFHSNQSFITSPYLDNRVGIYNLLKVAERMNNGALVFSAWEEHGGGSIPYLVKYIYEEFQIAKMLVSDVTWISDGIEINRGAVISNRDKNIPRKLFFEQIKQLADSNNISYQIEVEAFGSSDAREIQQSPYPIDWCFIGPAVEYAHSANEKISFDDIKSTINLYQILMEEL